MFKNYLKIALRHIVRNKSYLLINIIGLGLAIACCIIAFVNYQYFETADRFHTKSDQIFRVTVRNVGVDRPKGNIVSPVVSRAVADIPQVKEGVRVDVQEVIVKQGTHIFSESILTVDPNFLEVFTYKILQGDANALANPSNIILTEAAAEKYFGEKDPLGEVLSINPGQSGQKEFQVAAVMQNTPLNSALQFDLLTNITFIETGENPDTLGSWRNTISAGFVVLNDPQQVREVTEQFQQYITIENENENWRNMVDYFLQPMGAVYKNGTEITNNELSRLENELIATVPGIMSLLILLTACLNFTNTTISFSNKRLKEMGVRKVMGSNRRQLILQLLGESFLICLLALGVGMLLAYLLVPYYNQLWEMLDMQLTLDYLNHPLLIYFLIGTLLVTTLLGGMYPAFYMTSFESTHIFRGTTKFGGDNWLVRSLLGIQLVISLVSVITGITFVENAKYQQNLDLGYDYKSIINVPINGADNYEKLKTELASNPDIIGIAGSQNNLGFWSWWSNIGKPEDNRHVQVQHIGENFLEVMDIDIIEGRDFDKNKELDYESSILINKKLLDEQHWESGVGNTLDMFGEKLTVIGVTENFIPSSLFETQGSVVFTFQKPDRYQILKVKVQAEKLIATNNYLKTTWNKLFPFVPYEGYYQDELLATSLQVSQSISTLFLFLAIIAILLAATGLYSLVSLNLLKRAKEIAIRRVLGASTGNIAYLVNKYYLLIFLVGGILGGMGGIGGKLFTVLSTNPAETLKSE